MERPEMNPWEMATLREKDYQQIREAFGLAPAEQDLSGSPWFIKRQLLVGQEGLSTWLNAATAGRAVALVSGFMTSGEFHLGSLAVLRQMQYYHEQYGARLYIPIADLEALAVRKIQKGDVGQTLTNFLRHMIAAGIDAQRANIYLQTGNAKVLAGGLLYSAHITMQDLENIYKRRLELGEAISSLVMASDIVDPLRDGCESVLIILGIDEINHFVLTKEVIRRVEPEFPPPAITYHRMITGLHGSKMGKSLPQNSVRLGESPDSMKQKLEKAYPAPSLEGNWAWDILRWFCKDDALLARIGGCSDAAEASRLAHSEACAFVPDLVGHHQSAFNDSRGAAEDIARNIIRESPWYGR